MVVVTKEQNYYSEFEGLIRVEEGAEAYSSLSRLEEPAVVAAEHSTAASAAEAVESSAVSYMQALEGLAVQVGEHSSRTIAVLAGRRMKGSLL